MMLIDSERESGSAGIRHDALRKVSPVRYGGPFSHPLVGGSVEPAP